MRRLHRSSNCRPNFEMTSIPSFSAVVTSTSHPWHPGLPLRSGKTESELFEEFETTDTAPDYSHQHRDCHLYIENEFSVALLKTCRSIYNEAALFPLSSNNFIVNHPWTLDLFCKGLLPAQQKVAESLEVVCDFSIDPSPFTGRIFTGQLPTGLRHLRFRAEFPFNTFERQELHYACSRGLERLSQSLLISAKVIGYPEQSPTTPRIRKWAKKLEEKLLLSKEDREKAAEKKAKRKRDESDEGVERVQKRTDAR